MNIDILHKRPTIKFFSHMADMSGAPLVLIDLALEFKSRYPSTPVEFHTYLPVDQKNHETLTQAGLKLIVHSNRNEQLSFNRGDVLLLNTTAYQANVRESIFQSLKQNKLKKIIWYIHEDWPQTHFTPEEKVQVSELLESKKLTIYLPALRATKNYQEFFNNRQAIITSPFRITVPKSHIGTKSPTDFKKITFVMTGHPADLKGNLPILYAFLFFKNQYYDRSPRSYRDFEFKVVGLEVNDFTAERIRSHSKALGKHFQSYPPVSHEKALELIKESNVTISYSIRECLPISVFEGMLAGHVLLRNDTSGAEEQLIIGKNGYGLDSNDLMNVVETIERTLNIKKITNEELASMSKESYKIAIKQKNDTYEPVFKELLDNFD